MIGLREEFPVVAMDFQTAGEASAQIKRLLKKLGVNSGVVRRLSIACYEAEINLVIHSMGGRLTLIVDAHEVTLISDDDGPGIPERAMKLLFQVGYSTKFDPDTGDISRGVGLPAVQYIVEDLGGDIQVQSQPGQGACFQISLPLDAVTGGEP